MLPRRPACAVLLAVLVMASVNAAAEETVRDRLWLWGHPPGVFNAQLRRVVGRESTAGPVAAAKDLGIPNVIHIRYRGQPEPPFDDYYLIRYAAAALATGGIVESIDAIRTALSMDPRNRCYQVLLADAYAEAGLEAEAEAMLEKAGDLDSYDMQFVTQRRLEVNRGESGAARV